MKKYIYLSYFSIALYVISCCLPVTTGGYFEGLSFLILGIFSIYYPPAFIVWMSNILYFICVSTINKNRYNKTRMILSVIASITGSVFVFLDELPLNEGGVPTPIYAKSEGYFVWEASFIFMAVSSIGIYLEDKRTKEDINI